MDTSKLRKKARKHKKAKLTMATSAPSAPKMSSKAKKVHRGSRKSTTSTKKMKTSSTKKKSSTKGFETLSECHKALLKIAIKKHGLYREIHADFEGANFEPVLAYVTKHLSRRPQKALVKMYEDIERVSKRNKKLTGAPRTASGADTREHAQSSN